MRIKARVNNMEEVPKDLCFDVVMFTHDRQIDRRILLQADSLRGDGFCVAIIAMPWDGIGCAPLLPNVFRLDEFGTISLKNTIWLRGYKLLRSWLPMNSRLMRIFKSLVWRYFVSQESFYVKLFARAISDFSASVYVAHDLPMLPVAHSAVQQHSGAKLVYDSHELYCEQEFSKAEKRKWARIEKKYIKDCDLVYTVNESIAKEMSARYAISDVKVIYNAERIHSLPVKPRLFHQKYNLDANHKVLLYQGGLSVGRNIDVLVKAFAAVCDPTIHLVIMGDGKLKQVLSAVIDKLRIGDRVHLHDAVAQDVLLQYTASADAGIIPYQAICLNNYYCTPNKLFEFIAAGIPVLGSDLPEINKIVQGAGIGRVGILSTVASMATEISRFFADPKQFMQWQEQLLLVQPQWGWDTQAVTLTQMYREL